MDYITTIIAKTVFTTRQYTWSRFLPDGFYSHLNGATPVIVTRTGLEETPERYQEVMATLKRVHHLFLEDSFLSGIEQCQIFMPAGYPDAESLRVAIYKQLGVFEPIPYGLV